MASLRANTIYSSAEIRVIAIESIECRPEKSAGCYRLYASIVAEALIVCAADQTHVVNLASTEIPLAELESSVPGLRDLVGQPDRSLVP